MNTANIHSIDTTHNAGFPPAPPETPCGAVCKSDAKAEIQRKALNNAVTGESFANYQTILEGFAAMGIPLESIEPRVNVFTFNAWKALGRVVKKGQHGVKIVTMIPCTKKDKETGEQVPVKKFKNTTVFHISQTDALDGQPEAGEVAEALCVSESAPREEAAELAAPVVAAAVEEVAAEVAEEAQEPQEPNAYELRIQAKRERYEARAQDAEAESTAVYNRARKMAEVIPFGQPILVGHHSERGDRNYRNRIHGTYGKAFALQDKAKHYEHKAATVGTGGISSDDPDAIKKLRAELAGCEQRQERMKAANRVIRQRAGDDEEQVNGLLALGWLTNAQARDLVAPDFAGRIGFASYQLSNNNANMSRIKGRIAELERNSKRVDVEKAGEGFTYREDTAENRVMFIFDGKPDAPIRDILKAHAFKWSPSRGAWVRQLNNAGTWSGKVVFERLTLAASES